MKVSLVSCPSRFTLINCAIKHIQKLCPVDPANVAFVTDSSDGSHKKLVKGILSKNVRVSDAGNRDLDNPDLLFKELRVSDNYAYTVLEMTRGTKEQAEDLVKAIEVIEDLDMEVLVLYPAD